MTDTKGLPIKNKRILITGGTGFFGKSLIHHSPAFYENDFVLLSPDVDELKKDFAFLLRGKRIEFIRGDVRDFAFPETNFDYILHAATTSGKIIPDDEMRSVVIDGTRRVLEFAAQNRDLSRLLYISSGAVYGSGYNVPLQENFPCGPETVYGKAKLEAEQLCLDSEVPCSIARCFAFVGEYLPLNAHFAIGNFLDDCLKNREIVIQGDGTPVRTYLYAGDLAHWLWTLLLQGKPGRVYNVGSDDEISIRNLAETVRKISGTSNKIRVLAPIAAARPQRYVPDVSRARKELGLEVKTSFEEAIRLTLEYHRQRRVN
ncbi:dTDP-glucose 4,6-dehydratase [Syntrophus gentianae]|uniref:dTDP-glucose 4,6-dehydratase n=1 Tax=Syntrophus gentianae TaxID=43775 RepID=A0A1H7Z936_9BACT|nr:NAD-dependent epimerase/dehydratase family protein [Syntrophus gentianae]SEM54950.1 dTDP-glucose 4,6-dehydratase [Syntrophus gentianae]